MNKELKALAMLFPQVFDGEDLLPDEFMEEAEAVQRVLLSKALFVKLFLKDVDYADNKFSDYDSDELLEVFKLTSQDLLKDSNILETAAMANPMFLGAFSPERITSEIILLAISSLETKFIDDSELVDFARNIMRSLKDSKAWDDPGLLTKLEEVLDKSKWENENPSNLGGTVFWIRLIAIAPQEVFDDLVSLKSLLKIFISGISDEYYSGSAFGECFSFWDGFEWQFWSELIDFENFEQKIINSQHLQQEEIQSLVELLTKCIEEQETELEYWYENKPNEFIAFLKSITVKLGDFNEERSKKLIDIKINSLAQESDEVKADRDIVLAVVENDGKALEYASDELKADKEIVLAASVETSSSFQYANEKLKADKEFVLDVVQQNGSCLYYASNELKADKEIVLAAVQNTGHALEDASDELKADKEVVLAAVNDNGCYLRDASDELKADKEVVLTAIKTNGHALECASDELKANQDVVLEAVKRQVWAIQYASENIIVNKKIAMILIQGSDYRNKYFSFSSFDPELKMDREIILAASKQDRTALGYASDELKEDKEFVLAIIKEYGSSLEYASDQLKGDKEIVMAAVKENGNALKHASEELKADKEIVMAAVKQDGYALEHASEELQNDTDILSARGL